MIGERAGHLSYRSVVIGGGGDPGGMVGRAAQQGAGEG